MALRERRPDLRLSAWSRREEAVKAVAGASLADVATTKLADAVEGADLIVLCMPVTNMPALARELLNDTPASPCIVTDVGSVKGSLVGDMEQILAQTNYQYVGSHPMAGSEKAGLDAASAQLFQDRSCVITPTLFTSDAALKTVRALWGLVGCRTLEMSPEEHDTKIARISHLPHLMAAVTTLAALQHDTSAALCAGNGFRDTTRVSAGDADLWTGIVLGNRPQVLSSLRDAQERLSELVAILNNLDEIALRRFLADAKSLRDAALPGS